MNVAWLVRLVEWARCLVLGHVWVARVSVPGGLRCAECGARTGADDEVDECGELFHLRGEYVAVLRRCNLPPGHESGHDFVQPVPPLLGEFYD